MKKMLVLSVGALLLLSSCGSYTAAGTYTGASFGSIIGSAIGGIAGGPRGSDVGTLIGMAGGAMVGAAVGAAADNAEQKKYEDYRRQRMERVESQRDRDTYYGGGEADDRLYGFGEDFTPSTAPANRVVEPCLEIRNPRIVDATRDHVLSRGEDARIVFEVFNTSAKPVFRVLPSVKEVTGNRHIHISENVLIESIMPGRGIRYSAIIRTDDRLRDGEAVIRVSVFQDNRELRSQAREFRIITSKR